MRIDVYNLFSKRSLGRDLLLRLVPIIVMVALVSGTANFFITTRRETRILHKQADEMAENLARVLSWSIYQSNYRETLLIGTEYRKSANVISIRIVDGKHDMTYNIGDSSRGRHIVVNTPIVAFSRNLGSVEVTLSMETILRQQQNSLSFILLNTFSIIIAVCIAVVVLLELKLGKPLYALIDAVGAIALGSYEHKIAPLEVREFDSIAQSVNKMADKIAAREKNLKMLVSNLERQIAERKQAEIALNEVKERFEEMANLLPEVIYETDERGYFTFLNRSGFRRFGYDSEAMKKGLKLTELFATRDRDRIEKDFETVLNGRAIGSSEYLARKRGKKTFEVLVHFSPIIHSGIAKGTRGIAVDISERKRIERALVQYQQELRSLTNELLVAEEKERCRIASELHDRVGHALTNVSFKLSLLRDASNGEKKKSILKEIRQLLEQSSQDVQSLIFEISPPILYDLGLVAAIEWLTEKASREHGLKIEFTHDDSLDPISSSLRALVFRVLQELLLNVVKHAKARCVAVSISKNGESLVVSVQDDGIGISERRTSSRLRGGGFGLFSMKERISHLHGRFHIDSKPNKGTIVVLEIPYA